MLADDVGKFKLSATTHGSTLIATLAGVVSAELVSHVRTGYDRHVRYSGIYEDGWIAQSGQVLLAPGPAGDLTVQVEVLPRSGQQLQVVVDGQVLASETVAAGPLAMRIPVPESPTPRNVELRWTGTTRLSDQDPREAAALLKSVEIMPPRKSPPRRPFSIRLPGTLGSFGQDYTGIYRDGWVEKDAHVVLAGGGASRLVLRGYVFVQPRQHLEIVLDGESLFSENVEPGVLNLHLPIQASDSNRRIELRWGETAQVGPGDPREAAALIRFIGIHAGSAPKAQWHLPEDFEDPDLESGGVYEDGWLEQSSHLILAGGEKGVLVVRAEIPAAPDQHLAILLNGSTLTAQAVAPGPLEVRVPVPPADSNRRIELLWRETVPVGPDDPRETAALLRFIGVTTGEAPEMVQLPSALRDPNFEHTGIHKDGWAERHSTAVLAGGPAAQLIIRARVLPTQAGQRLDVSVDGSVLDSRSVSPGEITLQIAVPASTAPRRVELAWAATTQLGPDDRRQAAALLRSLALAPGSRI